MINFLTQAAGGQGGSSTYMWIMIGAVVVMLGSSFFTKNKEKKEADTLMNDLEVGDEIMTTAGIIGLVVDLKDDNFVLETGTSKTSLLLTKQAIYKNTSAQKRLDERKKLAKENKSSKKSEK